MRCDRLIRKAVKHKGGVREHRGKQYDDSRGTPNEKKLNKTISDIRSGKRVDRGSTPDATVLAKKLKMV